VYRRGLKVMSCEKPIAIPLAGADRTVKTFQDRGIPLAAIDHVKGGGGNPRNFFGKIYGRKKNLTTSPGARMNLVFHGIENFQITREDTLCNPAFIGDTLRAVHYDSTYLRRVQGPEPRSAR